MIIAVPVVVLMDAVIEADPFERYGLTWAVAGMTAVAPAQG